MASQAGCGGSDGRRHAGREGRADRCQVGGGQPVGTHRITIARPPACASSSTWLDEARPGPGGTPAMNPAVRNGSEIAAAISAVVTVTFVVLVRLVWSREKSLREP